MTVGLAIRDLKADIALPDAVTMVSAMENAVTVGPVADLATETERISDSTATKDGISGSEMKIGRREIRSTV
jgi:hypothetical protein